VPAHLLPLSLQLAYELLPLPAAIVLVLAALGAAYFTIKKGEDNKSMAEARSEKRASLKADQLIQELTQQEDAQKAAAAKRRASADKRASDKAKVSSFIMFQKLVCTLVYTQRDCCVHNLTIVQISALCGTVCWGQIRFLHAGKQICISAQFVHPCCVAVKRLVDRSAP
jgi:Flp pilus assembly protein TadB